MPQISRWGLIRFCQIFLMWSMNATWLIPRIDPNGKQSAVYTSACSLIGVDTSFVYIVYILISAFTKKGSGQIVGLTDSDSNWSSINILVISLAHLSNLETHTRGSHVCNFLHQLNLVEVYCKTFGCNPSTFGWDIIKTRFWEWIFWPIFFSFIFLPIALKHSVKFLRPSPPHGILPYTVILSHKFKSFPVGT